MLCPPALGHEVELAIKRKRLISAMALLYSRVFRDLSEMAVAIS